MTKNNSTSLTEPTLLVMAAGMGSRYGGLKQIDPVGPHGESILDYSVFDSLRAGFGKIVFIIRRDIEKAFKDSVGARFKEKIGVQYVFQELDDLPAGFSIPQGREKPWGTGHAILAARQSVQSPFAVINADDFYGTGAFQCQSDFLKSARDTQVAQYSMVGYILRNTLSDFGYVSRGICDCDGQGNLKAITEHTHIEKEGNGAKTQDDSGRIHPLTGDEQVSMNLWGFTPSIFEHLREGFLEFLEKEGRELKSEFYLTTVINGLLDQNKANLKVLPCRDSWFGVTYPGDKENVVKNIRKLIDRGIYPEDLWRSKS